MNNGTNIAKGIGSGFVATIGLSVIMLMKQGMGLMPELNPIQMITQMSGATSPVVGWLVHFFIGTVLWGRPICLARSIPARSALVPRCHIRDRRLACHDDRDDAHGGRRTLRSAPGHDGTNRNSRFALIYGALLGGVYGAWAHPEHIQPAHAR